MEYEFSSTVSRGHAKGEPMEAWRDSERRYELFDPTKRDGSGSVRTSECVRVRSSTEAKRLVGERAFSMRMRVRG